MRNLLSAPASKALRPYVRAYAQRDVNLCSTRLMQPVPASLEQILEFDFFDPPRIDFPDGHSEPAHQISLVGPHTHPGYQLHLSGRIQSFAIFFEPFGLWQLFRFPSKELVDTHCGAQDALGASVEELSQRLAACASFTGRVHIAETFLLQRLASLSGLTPVMNAAAQLFRNRGTDRVHQLATGSGLSLRHFERRFAETTGIPPKLFARITRFQSAVDIKLRVPSTSWLEVAHILGYHDQTHMIRDFHKLGGAAPNGMISELGDTRPPALVSS